MITINFNNSAYDTLPPILRTTINFHWVQVLIKPLKDIYDMFVIYVFNNDFELKHNSQVLSFEDYLNTKIPPPNPNLSGITITDGLWSDQYYVWYESEIDLPPKRTYLEFESESGGLNPFIYFEIEYNTDVYDFIINYNPEDLISDPEYINNLTTWIDTMRIIGTTYIFKEK